MKVVCVVLHQLLLGLGLNVRSAENYYRDRMCILAYRGSVCPRWSYVLKQILVTPRQKTFERTRGIFIYAGMGE